MSMEFGDLYQLSKTSTTTRKIVKMFTRKGSEQLSVRCLLSDGELKINVNSRPYSPDGEISIDEKFPDCLSEIADLFNTNKISLYFYSPNLLHETILYIKRSGLKFHEVEVFSSDVNINLYKLIITECSSAALLHITRPPMATNYQLSRPPIFYNQLCVIGWAQWVSLRALSTCFWECKTVELRIIPHFKFNDLNRFLRNWISREESKIRNFGLLSIEKQELSADVILKDIPHVVYPREWSSFSYKIQHDNGKQTVLHANDHMFSLTVDQ